MMNSFKNLNYNLSGKILIILFASLLKKYSTFSSYIVYIINMHSLRVKS